MRYLLFTLLIASTIASAEVFKTINPDGSTSYSDVKTEGAEAITAPELTPTPAVKYPKKKPAAKTEEKAVAVPYQTFSIASPADEETIRDNNGNVSVSFTINPALQTKFKHSITVLLDGKARKTALTTTSAQLQNIDRGMHSLSAQIVDGSGKVINTSNIVTIHMKRQSKLHGKTPGLWPSLEPLTATLPPVNAL